MVAFELLQTVAVVVVAGAAIFWVLMHVPMEFLYGPPSKKPAAEQHRPAARARFWPMMVARAIIAVFMVWLLFSSSRIDSTNPVYPHPDSSKAAALVALVIVIADTLWDILRRCKH